jgi:hypothetical protein
MMAHENKLRLDGSAAPIYSSQESLLGEPEVVGWRKGDLAVEEIDRDIANEIIRQNHYSGKIYKGTYLHYGAFWRGELVGIAQYGYAMNPASQESVVSGTKLNEYLELNRLWVDDSMPKNSESALLALTLRVIKATTRVKWIQSFADERCRLFGAVYQACSFLYCGEHTATFWEVEGTWFHNSLMSRDPSLTPKARFLQENKHRATPYNLRQFRYLKFLDPSYRSKLQLKTYPYPKPDAEGVEETNPANQQGSVGAMPTLRS